MCNVYHYERCGKRNTEIPVMSRTEIRRLTGRIPRSCSKGSSEMIENYTRETGDKEGGSIIRAKIKEKHLWYITALAWDDPQATSAPAAVR